MRAASSIVFSPPAPEQLLLQALVPNGRVKEVTEAAIKAGHLDRVGSGAVFTIDCNDAFFSQSFPGAHSDDQDNSQEVGSGDLEAICCICEKGIADDIAVPRSKVELQVRQLRLAREVEFGIKYLCCA